MKTPPFVMGLALLLWGWRMGFLLWVFPMAVALEAAHWVKARWDLSPGEMNRIWDLCVLLTLGETVVILSSRDRLWGQISFQFFQWLPLVLFPMMAAQAFGSYDKIPMSVFWLFLRRNPSNPMAQRSWNISPFYLAVCLTGASATARDTFLFYPAIVIVILLALEPFRPRRISLIWWLGLTMVAFLGGFAAQGGLKTAQSSFEASMIRWIATLFRRDMEDMKESRTAIGRSGTIRLSGKIVYRVKPENSSLPPELLREASFDSYDHEVWFATMHDMSSCMLDTNDTAFLLPSKRIQFTARISRYLNNGSGLLAVPHGTYELHDLPVITLMTNRLGVLKVDEGPSFVNYQALFGPGASMDSIPGPMDLKVPEAERATLEEIVRSLGLNEKSDWEKVTAIDQYFQRNFRYTLNLESRATDRSARRTPLGLFLTETHAGHCEYFATATVLLLRSAGVPARYVTGYAVQEMGGNGTYIVRERHAHAWVLAYRQEFKRWEEVDTTPGDWSTIDGAKGTGWEAVSDFFSRIAYEFNRWRESKTGYTVYLAWALGFLVLLLAWRLIFSRKRARLGGGKPSIPRDWPGNDSEFPKIERDLADVGLGRLPGETFEAWARRSTLPDEARLRQLFQLHRRLRFDPLSLDSAERQALRTGVQEWRRQFMLSPSVSLRAGRG